MFLHRYLVHMLKLVEAMHVLSSTKISKAQLTKAENLLKSYVKEYEEFYGEKNMVFNTHLLLHKGKCVTNNGPLYAYSNYSTEDNLGHLVSFVKGPTDVLWQILDRYYLEKNLHEQLKYSPRARIFHDQIARNHFSVTTKLGNFLLIGKGHEISDALADFVYTQLEYEVERTEEIISYRAIFLDSKIYYESATIETSKKRTYDSFVANADDEIYGEIHHILVIRNQVYFIIKNQYSVKQHPHNISDILVHLEEKTEQNDQVINSEKFKEKFALMKTDSVVICSKFPNMYERN